MKLDAASWVCRTDRMDQRRLVYPQLRPGLILSMIFLIPFAQAGCDPVPPGRSERTVMAESVGDLSIPAADISPLTGEDWEISTLYKQDRVQESLQTCTEKVRDYGWGFPFRSMGYGYGWWSTSAGKHDFRFAWEHGGQLIVKLEDPDLLIGTTADAFYGQHDGNSREHEKAVFELVGGVHPLPAWIIEHGKKSKRLDWFGVSIGTGSLTIIQEE